LYSKVDIVSNWHKEVGEENKKEREREKNLISKIKIKNRK
jgi:hypothetical protein